VHGEPDLATRVVRDVFNEDFKSLIVQGERAWETVSEYVEGVAPDLADRLSRHAKNSDLFHDLRVDEQLMKALDRKVWLPSGGSLVIDRTEAMTVIDVNTGKFVGAGGNLEQTVTRNNLEAAEEIVRQLRLRDVGGIVVIDFIDMVLESNRELVLRRLTECLGRDRTKHQVAEVTSLGLVQMTRKRVGEGLLEAFSETCDHCKGRGVILHTEPVDRPTGSSGAGEEERSSGRSGRRKRGGRAGGPGPDTETLPAASDDQRRAATAAIAAVHRAAAGENAEGDDGLDALASGLVAAAMAGSPDGGRADADEADLDVETVSSVDVDEAVGPGGEQMPEPVPASGAEDSPSPVPAQDVAEPSSAAGDGRADPEAAPEPSVNGAEPATTAPRRRRRAASRPAGPPTAG
jgi:ribonuclease E